MRKLIVLLVFVSCALSGFRAGDGFTITGKLTGLNVSKVYLIVSREGHPDTIASSSVTDDSFVLEGEVKQLQEATIKFEGENLTVPLYLENASYELSSHEGFDMSSGKESRQVAVSGGGETQQVASKFSEIQREMMAKYGAASKEFSAARSANDMTRAKEIQDEFLEYTASVREKEKELLAGNPGSLASLANVAAFARQAEYEALRERFDLLSEEMKETKAGKMIAGKLAREEAGSVGKIAPDFELDTPEGEKISLYGVQAKVKLIDFWASWCGPCRGENPNVVAMYKEYHPKGLEIIGVSLDKDKEAWIKAIADDELTWKHGSDLQFWQAAPAKLYGVNAIPHTVLLDESNRIIAKNLRGKALRDKIAELLD